MREAQEQDLAHAFYWNRRYAIRNETDVEPTNFEWFRSYETLRPFLARHLPPPATAGRILHLGCGNSTLPLDLLAAGYKDQVCVDFSEVLIGALRGRYATICPKEISWEVMNVRCMRGIEDAGVDVAIDKGTLDAMISGSLWDPPKEVRKDVREYLDEVVRVLKPGGVFLYITYRQPHFMKIHLLREGIWTLSLEVLNDEGGTFEYFGYELKKIEDSGELEHVKISITDGETCVQNT